MNESFFGKYSVFCVFGSVVGCVIFPLVAQLVQHQVINFKALKKVYLYIITHYFSWNS